MQALGHCAECGSPIGDGGALCEVCSETAAGQPPVIPDEPPPLPRAFTTIGKRSPPGAGEGAPEHGWHDGDGEKNAGTRFDALLEGAAEGLAAIPELVAWVKRREDNRHLEAMHRIGTADAQHRRFAWLAGVVAGAFAVAYIWTRSAALLESFGPIIGFVLGGLFAPGALAAWNGRGDGR